VRLIRSAGITLVLILLAWPFAVYSGKPMLAPVIAAWSFILLLDGFSSLAFAQAVRDGKVARLSWMEFGVNLFQVTTSIIVAWWLHNYWSIVIAVLLGAVVKVILSYSLFPGSRRRFSFSRARAREIWKFSRFIAGSSFLSLLLGQSDKVVLSRALPLAMFGIYSIATLLALAPPMALLQVYDRILPHAAHGTLWLLLGAVAFAIAAETALRMARGQILGDHTGMLKLCFHRETLELLGVHIIGEGATELIHIGQAVIVAADPHEAGIDRPESQVMRQISLGKGAHGIATQRRSACAAMIASTARSISSSDRNGA